MDCPAQGIKVQTNVESPFNFETADVPIKLKIGEIVEHKIVLVGDHGRIFDWVFTVTG